MLSYSCRSTAFWLQPGGPPGWHAAGQKHRRHEQRRRSAQREQLGLGSLPGAWGAEDDAIEAPAVGSGHGRPATQDLFQID